jgi:hypothetical protein
MSWVPIRTAHCSGCRCHSPESAPPIKRWTPTLPACCSPSQSISCLKSASRTSCSVCSTRTRIGRHQTSRRGQLSFRLFTRCQSQAARTPSVLPNPVGIRIRRLWQNSWEARSICQLCGMRSDVNISKYFSNRSISRFLQKWWSLRSPTNPTPTFSTSWIVASESTSIAW